MRSRRSGGLVVSVSVLVGCLAATPARGADDMAVQQGKQLYTKYCASCHGNDAKGDGTVGLLMNPKASDLTVMAKKNGGKFPFYETMLLINGRSATSQNPDASLPGLPKAHGAASMPVWGEVFSRDELSKGSSMDLQLQATGKIMMITEYLQSVQAK